jgi:hypothetical protein
MSSSNNESLESAGQGRGSFVTISRFGWLRLGRGTAVETCGEFHAEKSHVLYVQSGPPETLFLRSMERMSSMGLAPFAGAQVATMS